MFLPNQVSNCDLMLEIKDKQISAIKAANTLHHLAIGGRTST